MYHDKTINCARLRLLIFCFYISTRIVIAVSKIKWDNNNWLIRIDRISTIKNPNDRYLSVQTGLAKLVR